MHGSVLHLVVVVAVNAVRDAQHLIVVPPRIHTVAEFIIVIALDRISHLGIIRILAQALVLVLALMLMLTLMLVLVWHR